MSKRLLKSQCSDFVFKRDCLLCGNVCKMNDSNNPHRWVQFRQCKTVNRGSAITFKQQLENLCDEITETLEEALRSVLSIVAENANESRTTSVLYVM